MFLTVFGFFIIAILIILLIAVIALLNIELFVYADYSYGRSVCSLRIVGKLFRHWQLFERDFSEQDAKEAVETAAKVFVDAEQPQVAELVKEHTIVNTVPSATQPKFEFKRNSDLENKVTRTQPLKINVEPTATARQTAKKSDKLFSIIKTELYNNPGRNVLLLLAILCDLKKLISYLIKTSFRSFSIKKMVLYCKFGAEDPFDTGQVSAVVYTSLNSLNYIRQHPQITIIFQPDFEKTSFEFDGDAIILIKAITALLKILGAILGALVKGVLYYGGKITWRLGPNYFRKPQESDIN
ncbi:MAG: DUF2953 domain-containing protein [Bacillota bacterium]